MELKAENRFTLTRELFVEGSKRLDQEERAPFVRKIMAVLAVVWVLTSAFMVWKGAHWVLPAVEFVVVVAIYVWMSVYAPRVAARKGWQSVVNRCGEDGMERDTLFYEDRLEAGSGSGTLIVNYEDVRKTLESQNLIILLTADSRGIMLLKDGFTKGGMDVVAALLEEWKR